MACALTLACAPMALAQTFYVNSPKDVVDHPNACANVASTDYTPSGPTDTCTLPDAIAAVTAGSGENTIEVITCGPFVITKALATIPGGTALEGFGAGAATCNDADNPYSPNYGFAHLEGSGSGPGGAATFAGLVLGGAGSTVAGFAVNGFTDAIQLRGSGRHHVYDDAIGADPFEQGPDLPENTGDGVQVMSGSADDVIGYAPADGAVNEQDDIYGNGGWGIALDAGSGPTTVGHNFIGTDTSGHLLGPGDDYGYQDPTTGAASPGDGPTDGNGAGGIDVGDASGDVIGGHTDCTNVGDTCTTNVIANNGGPGVTLAAGSSGATVVGNLIGLSLNFYNDPVSVSPYCAAQHDLACPSPNQGAGVLDLGSGNTIGASANGAGNQISGNTGPGVELEGTHANVVDNLIGQDLAGSGATANTGAGILTSDAAGQTIGSNRISGNVIGGNTGPGVELDQSGTTLANNVIGTGGDRTSPLANAVGVLAQRSNEQIGAPVGAPNTIAHNTGAGVDVLDAEGASQHTTAVSIYRNSVFANGGLGIDLGGDGVTANHPLDSTPGPNGWQNFPVITSASAVDGTYALRGTLDTAPNGYYAVYVYANPTCDPSGYGQGQTYVASGELSTDANGHASFALSGTGLTPGETLSATADGSGGSEFGPCFTVTGGVDISVSQTVANGGTVVADEPADIDIHIANRGTAPATGLVLTDTLPADATLASPPAGCPPASGDQFKCSVGDLAAGASEDVHILLTPSDVPTLTDTVEVDADQLQSPAGDNVSDFSTAVAANPNETSGPYALHAAAPSFGHYLRLDRLSGTVDATLPNHQRIDLRNFAIVPVGTVVQATKGLVKVTAALPGSTHTSYANVKYGSFRLAQARTGGGDVNLIMNGSLAGCTARQLSSKHRRSRADTAKAAPKRRRLWGHDHGSFTITGNRGAATVRGTIWQVLDTCTTTVVTVYQDKVSVTAIGNSVPKRATVTAGHHLVLRAS